MQNKYSKNTIGEQNLKSLENIVGNDNVLILPEDCEKYSHDETVGLSAFPDVVVKPGCAKEIQDIMYLANKEKIPVTPRGAGTGLSGGAIPKCGGIVLSLERLNKIIEIDTENMMAIVEPCVINADLGKEANKYDLFYPPDPASLDSCSIGGNIAECAGGARTLKYGTTKNYVTGLNAVIPTGEIITCGGKLVKNVVGYNLMDLILGSEGTLAIITQATLRLLPLPKERVILLIPYKDIESAANSAFAMFRQKILPSAIEFAEKSAIEAAEIFLKRKLPYREAEAQLFIELDGEYKEQLEKEYNVIGDIALSTGAIDVIVSTGKLEQEKIWEARRCISDALKEKYKLKVSEDVIVPRNKIPALLKGIKEIGKKHSVTIISFGHIGDGNVHTNILSESASDRKWKNKCPLIIKELFELVIKLGGTISAEHGIGLAKQPYINMALDDTQIALMKNIKKVFDPNNILNPGKIF
ncbi:MAG: FAD-binding oxidoreductase [bacterium]|nr:FAD-binding oxidoreductase [bacterium]